MLIIIPEFDFKSYFAYNSFFESKAAQEGDEL